LSVRSDDLVTYFEHNTTAVVTEINILGELIVIRS